MKLFSTILLAVVCAGFVGTAHAAKKEAVVTSFEAIKWFPMDPKNPDGGQMGVASGDPQKGASVTYLKLPKGPAPLHSHSADYHAVLVKGEAKHWAAGKEANAEVLKAGSYWFQPGKQDHGDECVSADGCVIALNLAGKFDFIPAKAAKK
ncbi:MAG TPA: DUF4437 domain-containing protein [Bdellovibrionales bacterium]|nr:DUF4437 domain-containing protein [Bdellovibrionales bacterium]